MLIVLYNIINNSTFTINTRAMKTIYIDTQSPKVRDFLEYYKKHKEATKARAQAIISQASQTK